MCSVHAHRAAAHVQRSNKRDVGVWGRPHRWGSNGCTPAGRTRGGRRRGCEAGLVLCGHQQCDFRCEGRSKLAAACCHLGASVLLMSQRAHTFKSRMTGTISGT